MLGIGHFLLTVAPFEMSPQWPCLFQQLVRETILPEHVARLTYLKDISYLEKSLSYTLLFFCPWLPGVNAVVYVCYASYLVI